MKSTKIWNYIGVRTDENDKWYIFDIRMRILEPDKFYVITESSTKEPVEILKSAQLPIPLYTYSYFKDITCVNRLRLRSTMDIAMPNCRAAPPDFSDETTKPDI